MKDIDTMATTTASAQTQKWIVCRVCLQQPKEAMACIFNDDASKDLTNMILECGGVPIKKFDHYPDKICDKCLKCLHIAFKFRRNCERSYKHLSQYVAPVDVEQQQQRQDEASETEELKIQAQQQVLNEAQELPDEMEHEILVDLEKDMIVHVKSEHMEDGAITEELYDVYESYDADGDEVAEETAGYEELTEQSLSGLSADIEYIEQVDQDQLTESAHEDEIEVQQHSSDEEFVPINARIVNTRTLNTRAAVKRRKASSSATLVAKGRAAGQAAKMQRNNKVGSNIILNPDESITIGDTIVRKATGIKTRGGRKILMGDKKEFKYICDICGNLYPSQSRLTEHIKVHSGVKPHECEICGHAFAQAQQLARHMNTHTGNRPYKCTYCPAAFADLSTRNKHHRIHTNERPYECDVCHKTFTYTNTLKFHKMIHTGEKPHVCDICGKGFPQAYKLRNHMVTHERRCVREPLDAYIHCDSSSAAAGLEL